MPQFFFYASVLFSTAPSSTCRVYAAQTFSVHVLHAAETSCDPAARTPPFPLPPSQSFGLKVDEEHRQLLVDEGIFGIKKPKHCEEALTSDEGSDNNTDDEEEFHSGHARKKPRTGNSSYHVDANDGQAAGGSAGAAECSQSSSDASTSGEPESQPEPAFDPTVQQQVPSSR